MEFVKVVFGKFGKEGNIEHLGIVSDQEVWCDAELISLAQGSV
jgi:hypothetical protein